MRWRFAFRNLDMDERDLRRRMAARSGLRAGRSAGRDLFHIGKPNADDRRRVFRAGFRESNRSSSYRPDISILDVE